MRDFSPQVTALAILLILGASAYAITDPAAGLPQALVGGMCGVALLVAYVRVAPSASPRLTQLIVAAVLIRIAAALVLHFVPQVEAAFAPDASGYDRGAKDLANFWGDSVPGQDYALHRKSVAYYLLVAVQYFVLGYSPLLPKVTNALLGALAVWYTFRIATALDGEETGWRAASLVAFFPSLILWSALNLRDALATLLILVMVWHTICLKQRFDLRSGLTLLGALILAGYVRDYIFPLMGAAVVAGILLTDIRSAPRNLMAVAMVGALVFLVYKDAGFGQRFVEQTNLEQLDTIRKGGAIGARTAYLTDVDISTPQGLLLFIPLGVMYFLLSPFPWQIGGLAHLMPMPEMLYWYFLVPMVFAGGRSLLRRHFSAAVVVLLSIVVLTMGYGVGSTNAGTAYRHRGQLMPLILCFAAAGMTLRARRKQQRQTQWVTAIPGEPVVSRAPRSGAGPQRTLR